MALSTSTNAMHAEENPEGDRITVPSPQPFPCVQPRVKSRSPGAYRIVNEEAVDDTPSTRREGR